MKAIATIKDEDDQQWQENYSVSGEERAQEEIQVFIDHWNKRANPGEKRELVGVVMAEWTNSELAKKMLARMTNERQNALCSSVVKSNYSKAKRELQIIITGGQSNCTHVATIIRGQKSIYGPWKGLIE